MFDRFMICMLVISFFFHIILSAVQIDLEQITESLSFLWILSDRISFLISQVLYCNFKKMSPKRKLMDSGSSKPAKKKDRKSVSLEVKLKVLNRFDAGEKAVEIGWALGLPPTTVRTIRTNAAKIRESLQSTTFKSAGKITRTRGGTMEKMEKLLITWIEDQNQRNMPITLLIIQEKAKSLYEDLIKSEGESSNMTPFTASRGWFERFKARSSLHNIKMTGEAASANIEAAKAYPAYLKNIIQEGGYTAQQVFNVDETGLFWKRMPTRTYISTEEKTAPGFKAAKDRLTLLVGGNAAGDFKLKPLLVYTSENPRAMRGYSKQHLPVIWRSNKKAWVTKALFQEWFNVYFCKALEEYCSKKNISHKALLILDNAPGHPPNLADLSENVQLIFLPPNTTALLQPMDQGVIATFKAYYLRRTFSQLIRETGDEKDLSIRDFWRQFNIMKAIDNIGNSWSEIKTSTMNSVWKKIWPECLESFEGTNETVSEIQHEIVRMANELGFNDVDEAGIIELLESHEQGLTNEDLLELEEQQAEEEALNEPDPPPITLTTKNLLEAFKHLDEAMDIFLKNDPNRERSSRVIRIINDGIVCYNELYKQKKKAATQLSIDKFITQPEKKTP